KNVAVDLDAELLGLQYRVESGVPRHLIHLNGHRYRPDRFVDDKIDSVLVRDVAEDVANVGIHDVEVDRLTAKSGLTIVPALRRGLDDLGDAYDGQAADQ